MKIDLNDVVVENNASANQFEAKLGDQRAMIAYGRSGDTIVMTHTEVPQAFEGQGVAGKLAKTALEYARAENLKVAPVCPYIAHYLRRHPEYQDLIDPAYRERVLSDSAAE